MSNKQRGVSTKVKNNQQKGSGKGRAKGHASHGKGQVNHGRGVLDNSRMQGRGVPMDGRFAGQRHDMMMHPGAYPYDGIAGSGGGGGGGNVRYNPHFHQRRMSGRHMLGHHHRLALQSQRNAVETVGESNESPLCDQSVSPDPPAYSRSASSVSSVTSSIIKSDPIMTETWRDADVISYNSKHQIMYIMRGLPGSGKSTTAKEIAQLYPEKSVVVCSADDYRYNKDGEYVWSAESLYRTHHFCQERAEEACRNGFNVVIIDNTNLRYRNIVNYLRMAQKYDYVVVLVTTTDNDATILAERNIHSISKKVIEKMKEHIEEILAYFYGWNIGRLETMILRDTFRNLYRQFVSIPMFKAFATRNVSCNAPSGSKKPAKDIYQIYNMKNSSTGSRTCHVTACFTNKEKSLIYKRYTMSELVQKSLGKVQQIKIIGWCITSRTLFARVLLDDTQRQLWGRNDAYTDERNDISIVDCRFTGASKVDQDADYCDDYVEDQILYEKLDSLSVGRNSFLMKMEKFVENIDEVYLQPDFGLGCTAHITVGIKNEMKPVNAKDDLQNILCMELNQEPIREWKLSDAMLRCYGDDYWVAYLKFPKYVPAVFCATY